jgi:uncharacterized GH25 family protein
MSLINSRSARAAVFAVGLGVTLAGAAGAHDFWVQPASFSTAPGVTTAITLQVGHGVFRQRTPIALRRILRFTASGPGGETRDLRGGLHLGGATEDGAIQFFAPGAYVLALETDAEAESHLPSIRYNDYLKAEGLTPAIDLRARTHRTDADGSENYRRCAKALVQVGPARAVSWAVVTRPVGMTLEIVPEANPYASARPMRLPVRVIYEGRPLAGALVKLNNLDHDEAPVEAHRSDAAGRAVFAMPPAGRWQMNVLWTKPLPRSRETDFETSFSSLSFGLPG